VQRNSFPSRVIQSGLRGFSAWVIASSLGAWTPVWIGSLGFLFPVATGKFSLALEFTLTLLCAAVSIPPLSFGRILIAFLLIAFLEKTVPVLCQRRPDSFRLAGILGFVMAAGLWLSSPIEISYFRKFLAAYPGHIWDLALSPVQKGEKIQVSPSVVAWLDRPSIFQRKGALLFHGANAAGANQSSALVLRRALVQAGYLVLSVDHPGFGESAMPSFEGNLSAWDPLDGEEAALQSLRELGVEKIILVGHSMGTADVLRLLGLHPFLIREAWIFGGSVEKTFENAAYWRKRFAEDRRSLREISLSKFKSITEAYYDNTALGRGLPRLHPPLFFVNFQAWSKSAEKALYDVLPGPKSELEVESSHSFSSTRIGSLCIGDGSLVRRLARIFH